MGTIPTRRLGRTDLEVSVLGYGAMELEGPPERRVLDETEVGRLLNAVLDAGIDLVDTSIDYGLSEERIGRHLASRRDEYVLTGKCGCPIPDLPRVDGRIPHDYRSANIRAGVEQSLRRLATDHLDVLQVHMSPAVDELEAAGTLETLTALRDEGKTRYIGMSGILPHLDDHIDLGVFDVLQIPFSALEPQHGPAIVRAAERGMGVIARGGVAKGALDESGPKPRGETFLPVWQAAELDQLLDGMSPSEMLLRYTIGSPGVTTAIVGTSSPTHLAANVAAAERGALEPDLHDEITRRVHAVTPQSPVPPR